MRRMRFCAKRIVLVDLTGYRSRGSGSDYNDRTETRVFAATSARPAHAICWWGWPRSTF